MSIKSFLSDRLDFSYKKCSLCRRSTRECVCPGTKTPEMYYTEEYEPIKGKYQTVVHGAIDQSLHSRLKRVLGTGGKWSPKKFTFRGQRRKVAAKLKLHSKKLGYRVDW